MIPAGLPSLEKGEDELSFFSSSLMPSTNQAKGHLVREALDYASMNGILMASKDQAGLYHHAPLALLPNPFPASEYAKAQHLAKIFNVLIERVSRDGEWMLEVLSSVLPHDEFTRRLVEIYHAVDGQGRDVQKLHLGINRSDYMLHGQSLETSKILQVEINTIASSFGCLSVRLSKLHSFLIHKTLGKTCPVPWSLPFYDNTAGLAKGLALAHSEYLRQYPPTTATTTTQPRPCVLMIVQPNERNIMDQKLLEIALWEMHGIPLHRATLAEIASQGHLGVTRHNLLLSGSGGHHVYDGEIEITVAYFRAGYTPNDYPEEEQWKGRELIEMSAAIKCPCISYHLAGTKKVQEALSRPGQLERFLPNKRQAALVRSCFAGLYGLEPGAPSSEAAVAKALVSPSNYVLKPQREGGGNNLYDEEMVHALKTMSAKERAAYILMEKIKPPHLEALFVREGKLVEGAAVYELGVYGVFIGGEGRVLYNTDCGHLLRTKLSTSNEGGVAAGYSVLSSPLLVGSVTPKDEILLRNLAEDREKYRRRLKSVATLGLGGLIGAVGVWTALHCVLSKAK